MALENFYSGYLNERADTFKSTITIHVAFHKDMAIKIFIYPYQGEVLHLLPLNIFLKNRRLPSRQQMKKSSIIFINNYVLALSPIPQSSSRLELHSTKNSLKFITCWVMANSTITITRKKHQNLQCKFYQVYGWQAVRIYPCSRYVISSIGFISELQFYGLVNVPI